MSAPSPMGRTAILIVMLAFGLTAFASDAPTSPTSPHRKAAAAHSTHEKARRTARAHETAGVQRRAAASHHTHSSSHHVRPSETRRTNSATRERVAVERVSVTHHRGVTAAELRRAHELKAEHERHTEQVAEPDDAKTESAKAPAVPADGATETTAASGDTGEAASGSAADESDGDPATTPALQDDDAAGRAEHASLELTRRGMPAPLRGSLASLERQDERLEADGLDQILDNDDLNARIAHHLLVAVPASSALSVNAQLPADRRYCRPWTARFLTDLARAHQAVFHRPLEVNSAVRTVKYQQHLVRINGNAAPAQGDVFSPHLMGATIDIAKKEMSQSEIAWMRRRLLALELAGKIDVEEEFEQACFHITVYKSYAPPRTEQPSNARTARSRRRSQGDAAAATATAGTM